MTVTEMDLPVAADGTELPAREPRIVPVATAVVLLDRVITRPTLISWYQSEAEDPAGDCPIKQIGGRYFVVVAWIKRQLNCDLDWTPSVRTAAIVPEPAVAA